MTVAYELTPCIICGTTASDVVADAAAMRAELEQLWTYHTRRLRPDTPPRHLADRIAFSQPPAMRLVRCRGCGLVFRNPVERAHELHDIYTGETPAPDVLAKLHATQLGAMRAQARRLTAVAGRAGTVIEVGSYVGGFLAAARELGWTPTGVDVNPVVNAWVRARGERVVDGELGEVTDVRADAIAFWNCFDQLADPAAALVHARDRLTDAGLVVIRVPNGDAYVRLRALGGTRAPLARLLLASNNLLAFPYRWGFTPRALAKLLARLGFSVERTVGDTLVPIGDRWTRPWARLEERVAKRGARLLASAGMVPPPWIEVYARRG